MSLFWGSFSCCEFYNPESIKQNSVRWYIKSSLRVPFNFPQNYHCIMLLVVERGLVVLSSVIARRHRSKQSISVLFHD